MSKVPAHDFRPSASLEVLQFRAQLLRRVRAFFDARGFWEVETPLLSADTVVDVHLDPLRTTLFSDPRSPDTGRPLWLQTSPEFGMKRLLASGAAAIYQVTKAFRGGEQGRLHNPEFTMVEWYRVGDGYDDGMRLVGELVVELLGGPAPQRLSYGDAFRHYLNIDPHTAAIERLAEAAGSAGGQAHFGSDRDAWLHLLLAERIEPHLGVARPTILYDYPASQAALARVRSGTDAAEGAAGEPAVAERFELYIQGVEIANGYHELVDSTVLEDRNQRNNALRVADGRPSLPSESRLLDAMRSGLPPCCGVALGFDRLVMVALGKPSLAEVLAFPIERA